MSRAEEIQIVTTDLIYWEAYDPAVKVDLSSTAVRAAGGWVLIDPIPLASDAYEEFLTAADPKLIVLTNGNHARAAADWRKRLGVPVFASSEAVPELEIEVDGTLNDGQSVAGDLRVISIPGAASGEVVLCAEGRSLHVGDALINLPPLGFTFLPDKYCSDSRRMRESLRKLLAFEFASVTFAHGLPLVKDAKAQLTGLLA